MSTVVRGARWPFLAIVVALLVLSILAPSRWRFVQPAASWSENAATPRDATANAEIEASRLRNETTLPAPVAREAMAESANGKHHHAAVVSRQLDHEVSVGETPAAVVHEVAGEVAPPSTAAASMPAENAIAHAVDVAERPADTAPQAPVTGLADPPAADVARLPERPDQRIDLAPRVDPLKPQPPTGSKSAGLPDPIAGDVAQATVEARWPMPTTLVEQLHVLAKEPETSQWAGEILCLLDDLHRHPDMAPDHFQAAMVHLRRATADGERLEAKVARSEVASQITRLRLAIERRMALWTALDAFSRAADRQRDSTGMSDELVSRESSSVVVRTPLPGKVLADTTAELLDHVEAYESAPAPHVGRQIALVAQRFAQQDDAQAKALAEHLGTHYRNANVRVAASGQLLNRFLVQPGEVDGDVNDYVGGVPVQGRQRTRTRLFLRLIPDERNVRMGLEAHGEVESDTTAHSGPATLYTTGDTRFLARKLVVLDGHRWRAFPAVAAANSETELTGVRTDFDPLPILGSIVHSIVRSKHEERRWSAQREVEDKVSSQASTQLDGEADPRLSKAIAEATSKFVEPLDRLGLKPTPISLATTEERVTMRYRLAGADQLGGHTPRPRAPGDSLLSVQIHESAINNALANLELAGKTFELRALYEAVATRLGRADIKTPEDVPERVKVTFAQEDPLQVRLVNNAAEVTLRLARLDVEKQSWRNVTVMAIYHPEVNGLDATFSRTEPIRLSGKNLNTRSSIMLRGVFTKMFTRNRQVHLLPVQTASDPRLADLAVNQLVVHDGWAGLAIGPKRAGGPAPTAAADAETARKPAASAPK